MVQYSFIDTGYKSSARLGTQLSGANIVNSGTAVDVDIQDIRIIDKVSIEHTPLTSSTSSVEANFVSVENREYTITVRIDKTVSADRTILKHLMGISGNSTYPGASRTKGVKAFYANGTSTKRASVLELLGRTDTNFHSNEITAGYPAMIGYIKNITCNEQPSGSLLTLSITFVETV